MTRTVRRVCVIGAGTVVALALLAGTAQARPNAKCEAAERNGVTAVTALEMCQHDVEYSGDNSASEAAPEAPRMFTFYDSQHRIDGARFGYRDNWVRVTR